MPRPACQSFVVGGYRCVLTNQRVRLLSCMRLLQRMLARTPVWNCVLSDLSQVERKSGYAVITKLPNKNSELVSSAIVSNLKHLAIRVKTLTYDNGKEFVAHGLIDQQLN